MSSDERFLAHSDAPTPLQSITLIQFLPSSLPDMIYIQPARAVPMQG